MWLYISEITLTLLPYLEIGTSFWDKLKCEIGRSFWDGGSI